MRGSAVGTELGDGRALPTVENVEVDKSYSQSKHRSKQNLKITGTSDHGANANQSQDVSQQQQQSLSRQQTTVLTMNKLLANKKDEIDKFYEEDKEEGDLDGRRGSFKEFYGLQKLMEKTGGEETKQANPMPSDGYVTGTITLFNKTVYNDEGDMSYLLIDNQGMSVDHGHLNLPKSPTAEHQSKSVSRLLLRDSFSNNSNYHKKDNQRSLSPPNLEDNKRAMINSRKTANHLPSQRSSR